MQHICCVRNIFVAFIFLIRKCPAAKKIERKTHLSPSRRRAVYRGNRETRRAMKPCPQGAPLLGLASPEAVSLYERNCERVK